MKIIFLSVMIVSVMGCAALGTSGEDRLKRYSAGFMDCTPEEIQITEDSGFWTNDSERTWVATCGSSVYCTVKQDQPASCR